MHWLSSQHQHIIMSTRSAVVTCASAVALGIGCSLFTKTGKTVLKASAAVSVHQPARRPSRHRLGLHTTARCHSAYVLQLIGWHLARWHNSLSLHLIPTSSAFCFHLSVLASCGWHRRDAHPCEHVDDDFTPDPRPSPTVTNCPFSQAGCAVWKRFIGNRGELVGFDFKSHGLGSRDCARGSQPASLGQLSLCTRHD
jgi:hypothetical protein